MTTFLRRDRRLEPIDGIVLTAYAPITRTLYRKTIAFAIILASGMLAFFLGSL